MHKFTWPKLYCLAAILQALYLIGCHPNNVECQKSSEQISQSPSSYFLWDIEISKVPVLTGKNNGIILIKVILTRKYDNGTAVIVKNMTMHAEYNQDAVFHREINGELMKAVFSIKQTKLGDVVSCDTAIKMDGLIQAQRKEIILKDKSLEPAKIRLSVCPEGK